MRYLCKKIYKHKSFSGASKNHAEQKPYECDICQKSYFVKSSHTVHKKTHTGEKAYECDVCKKSSLDQTILQYIREHIVERNLMSVIFVIRDFLKQVI